MPRTATALTSWCRAIKSALEESGADSEQLFRNSGLQPEALKDANARYPVEQTIRLWRLAVEATGDEAFGLRVSRHIRQTTFHALGYSLLASATLDTAFERLIRYFRIVTEAYELDWQPESRSYVFSIGVDEHSRRPTHEAIDAFAAVAVRLCRALYGDSFACERVELERPCPDNTNPWIRALRGPVQFGARRNAIHIGSDIAQAPLESANPDLAVMNDEIVRRYLAENRQASIVDRVHSLLVESLPNGDPGQQAVADNLHMSLRSLQRRLAEEDTAYQQVLNDTRRELALAHVANARYSLSEIAYLVGFSDSSSFTRAFKRWTGESPSQYRKART
jgi:AraC-like DNA-binding protein